MSVENSRLRESFNTTKGRDSEISFGRSHSRRRKAHHRDPSCYRVLHSYCSIPSRSHVQGVFDHHRICLPGCFRIHDVPLC